MRVIFGLLACEMLAVKATRRAAYGVGATEAPNSAAFRLSRHDKKK